MGPALSRLSCTTRQSTSTKPTQPELVVVVLKGAATERRLEWESKAITEGIGPAGTVHTCSSIDEVEAALRREFVDTSSSKPRRDSNPTKRVVLHVIGYACTTAPEIGRTPTRNEKTLSCERLRSDFKPRPGTVAVRTSKKQFVKAIECAVGENKLDLVFCNASDSAQLARSLPANRRFGWASACVEEGAARYAANFFAQLGRGLQIDAAFRAASEQLENTQVAVSIRLPTGKRDTALIENALHLGDPEAHNVRVGNGYTDRDLGEGSCHLDPRENVPEFEHLDLRENVPEFEHLDPGENVPEFEHLDRRENVPEFEHLDPRENVPEFEQVQAPPRADMDIEPGFFDQNEPLLNDKDYEVLYEFLYGDNGDDGDALDSCAQEDGDINMLPEILEQIQDHSLPIGLPELVDQQGRRIGRQVEEPHIPIDRPFEQPGPPAAGLSPLQGVNPQPHMPPGQPYQNNANGLPMMPHFGGDHQYDAAPRPGHNPQNQVTPPPTPQVEPRTARVSFVRENGHTPSHPPGAVPGLPMQPPNGTLIDRQLEAIGRTKINRLAENGIYTIEQLAEIDLSDIELCQNVTNNHSNPNQAVKTVRTWKEGAQRWLRSR